jgi:hypothetical protein
MAKSTPPDPKIDALRQRSSLNPRPDKVSDPLFTSPNADFFDARDLVQVKYEMVRRVRVDAHPASHVAAALVPSKPGPRRAHKLDTDVVEFLLHQRAADPSVRAPELARRVRERFTRTVHPRSVERALARREKKRR